MSGRMLTEDQEDECPRVHHASSETFTELGPGGIQE